MRKSVAWIAVCVLMLCTIFSAPLCYADSESVTKDTSWFNYKKPKDSYNISTEAQLMGLASLVNEEQVDRWKPTRIENFEGVTFTLTRDIKLTRPWTPIGKGGASEFAGIFDGNGHTISNVRISANAEQSGFFGALSGQVKDLELRGKISSSYSICGGIAGYMEPSATITGCTSDLKVSGKDKVGGIAGYNDGGIIEGCINIGEISGTHKIGGIVGENWGGKISQCGNRGTVESTRRGVSTYGTGGVAGRSVSATAEITESYNIGTITSYTEATGGVVGYANAKGTAVENCYNTGTIVIAEKKEQKEIAEAYAGGIMGIAGTNGVVIENCYSAGEIQNADAAGGVIGFYDNEDEGSQQFIFNNYYLKGDYNSGIGKINDEDDPYLSGAITEVMEGSMDGLHTSLSVSYMKDTGEYGNDGFPVLNWQQPVSDEEQENILDIPIEKRKLLDRYMKKNVTVTIPGQNIIDFFQPDNIMGNAFILYMDAKDRATDHAEDNEQNEE